MKRNSFVLCISEDTPIDLALMSEQDLLRIKTDSMYLQLNEIVKDETLATLAAFVVYLKDLEQLTDFSHSSKFM
jgi:hypothetical protein